MKENSFTLAKKRSRWYPIQTIMDTDDIALLANTPTQAKSLLHSLENAAYGIGFHVNADKTECMCFNQNPKGDISTLKGDSLKLVNMFTYFRSSVSSTENEINIRLAKAWIVIDRQSVIWRSDLSDKIKNISGSSCVYTTTWMLTKCIEKKLDDNCTKML